MVKMDWQEHNNQVMSCAQLGTHVTTGLMELQSIYLQIGTRSDMTLNVARMLNSQNQPTMLLNHSRTGTMDGNLYLSLKTT